MLRSIIESAALLELLPEAKKSKDIATGLLELLPTIFVTLLIMSAFKWLGTEVKVSWHKRLWYRVKHTCHKYRMELIGY